MTQMVLPQTPAPGMQNDAGASKSGSGRDNGASESRYEAFSRAEQKRLDRQQADARNSAKEDGAQSASQSEPPGKTGESGKSVKTSVTGEDEAAEKTTAGKIAETAPEMEAITTPLTFAELQALLLPSTGQVAVAGGAAGPAASSPAIIQGSELFAGLVGGKPGQPGQTALGGKGGLMSGLQLTDSLAPAAGEKASVMDPSSLLNGTRFESAMELVSQQSTNNAAGKLAAEAQVPLRSYATSVDVPVNHAEWGDKLMGKLSWLTAKNLSVAEIHLTPPDMGPMEVRVRVHNDQATITVHAANPVVRDQLELHSHRLRDMLGEQGLSLAQFDVSDNSQNQRGEQGAGDGDGSSSGSGAELSAADGGEANTQTGSLDLSWNGAVDIFA
ncbi:flagellar hook-length control protein FliK [Marinobacter antarcticus]|uniref:Flagellar hook-length control protein FliK n=1 Tax=Marinobacter antarcticus TaxID=564117 RepID=A0A1M6S1N1_9GAMM|nr:flagellar hook-length control protein FliK [Marinobacter antarcticus]SHK38566.1 flagellar hook-length control protein FliK [Marinobacter antarcticus]